MSEARKSAFGQEESRRVLLEETASIVARRWFVSWRDDLHGQGRVVEGGWPGTLPEARALVAASLAPALAKRRLSGPTHDELRWAMRATYAEAKRAWLMSRNERGE